MKQWIWILVVIAMGQTAIVRAETAPSAPGSHAPATSTPYNYQQPAPVDRGQRLIQMVGACLNDRPGSTGGSTGLDDIIRRSVRY